MSTVIRYERFWMRRDTEANWISVNPTLAAGEFGIVTDGAGMAMKLGDGSTAWNSLPYLHPQMATASGADTITATFDPKPVLVDGLVVYVKAAAANTTAVTFNPNSLGALGVKKQGGTALAAGDIAAAGHVLILVYRSSGTTWELLNPAQGSGGSGITALTGDVTASGSGSVAATIANDAVTYAKMQNVSAASKLLGRGSAGGSGDTEEITLGTGLTMTGTTISTSSTGGMAAGTSFPGSPATNDLYYRTDLGWICYYDGTRWLTDFEIALPALANIGQAGSGTAFGVYWYHALRQDYGLYLTKWSATTYVPTTNDGTKYWTCRLEWLTDANVATSLVSFTTASDTASRFTYHEQAINAVLSSSARALASTNSVKTSTPGNVLLLPTVYARLIVT